MARPRKQSAASIRRELGVVASDPHPEHAASAGRQRAREPTRRAAPEPPRAARCARCTPTARSPRREPVAATAPLAAPVAARTPTPARPSPPRRCSRATPTPSPAAAAAGGPASPRRSPRPTIAARRDPGRRQRLPRRLRRARGDRPPRRRPEAAAPRRQGHRRDGPRPRRRRIARLRAPQGADAAAERRAEPPPPRACSARRHRTCTSRSAPRAQDPADRPEADPRRLAAAGLDGDLPRTQPGARRRARRAPPPIGQILLMSKEQLKRHVLANPDIEIYACGREDIRAGHRRPPRPRDARVPRRARHEADGHLAALRPRLLHRERQRLRTTPAATRSTSPRSTACRSSATRARARSPTAPSARC